MANAQAWYGFLQNVYKFHYTALHQKRARTLLTRIADSHFEADFEADFVPIVVVSVH